MKQMNSDSPRALSSRSWSNRILAASLFGILFFTLFPYWVDLNATRANGRSPFLLAGPLRFDGILHTFLNALLFMPFGFALSQLFRGRRKSLPKRLAIAAIAGAVLSYSIEITQLYIPSRDSAWDDVIANALGALAGAAFGLIAGGYIFRALSAVEKYLEQILSLRKIIIVALIYFGIWLAVSIPLQHKSRLDNWSPNSFLIVGYDLNEDTRWTGAVSRIQLWDRSLSAEEALRQSGSNFDQILPAGLDSGLLASYDVSQLPPIRTSVGGFSDLVFRPLATIPDISHHRQSSDALSVLMSAGEMRSFTDAVRRSNQLTVSIDCEPRGGSGTVGAILDMTDLSGVPNFYLEQIRSDLVVYLKNGLHNRRAQLWWVVPDVFTENQKRSIVFSYDGARSSVYIDGKPIRQSAYFSPGAALVHMLIRVKTTELVAYSVLYESLIFLPIGFLLGLAARVRLRENIILALGICVCIIFPAMLLETWLVAISGKRFSWAQLSVSLGLTIAGMIWMNLDSAVLSPTP
jgi:glycopeptide antibiotics resistance protein